MRKRVVTDLLPRVETSLGGEGVANLLGKFGRSDGGHRSFNRTTSRVGPMPTRTVPVCCRFLPVWVEAGVEIRSEFPSQRNDSGTRYGVEFVSSTVAIHASTSDSNRVSALLP
jgi:hypothetical protein